jgi:hypothetical protein
MSEENALHEHVFAQGVRSQSARAKRGFRPRRLTSPPSLEGGEAQYVIRLKTS